MTRSFVMINYSFVGVLRLPPLRSTSTAPFVGPKDIRGVWPLSRCGISPTVPNTQGESDVSFSAVSRAGGQAAL